MVISTVPGFSAETEEIVKKIYNSNSNEISDANFTIETMYNSYVENVYPLNMLYQ